MIGQRVGHYEIVEELGKGGMASVYRAYDSRTERFVALKIIHRDLARDSGGIERFRREAQLISRLEHPYLLPVYDYSADHDPPYIVMRYLEGSSLKEIIDNRVRLPLSEIAHLVRQICAALEYAHRKNVIHRDIKPSNILVDQDGNAYLTDFGIARVVSTPGVTQTGFAVGTPGYMSPEQGYGLATIDYRADIYALGVMIFEMAVGVAPYTAPTPMGVLLKHLNDPIPSAEASQADLPAGLDDIIQKAMAKAPEDRYASARELADALVVLAGGNAANETPVQLRAAAAMTIKRIEEERDEDAIQTAMAKFERERAATPNSAAAPTREADGNKSTTPFRPAAVNGTPHTPFSAASIASDSALPKQHPRRRRLIGGVSFLILAVIVLLAVPVFIKPPVPPTNTPSGSGNLVFQGVVTSDPNATDAGTAIAALESASPEGTEALEADSTITSTLKPSATSTPEPTHTATLSDAEQEMTVQAQVQQLETEVSLTEAANATATATLWTATFTPDASLTAAVGLTETGQAQLSATQNAFATLTAQARNLTATADAWTDTPSPTATFTLTHTPTPTFTATATATATLTPTITKTPTPSATPTSAALVMAIQQASVPARANSNWTDVYPQGFEQAFDGVPMMLVPAGCINMGNDPQGYHWNGENYVPNVPNGGGQCFNQPFWIDKYEVSNEQFDRLKGKAANDSGFDLPRRPRESITWFEARDFCAKRGMRLPTEAEWEYAARGPDAVFYPWGNDFVAANTVYESNANKQTADVGTHPSGRSWVGAQDMGGNVWEWVGSWFAPYPYQPDDGREDLADTSKIYTERILRGGAWGNVDLGTRSAGRGGITPDYQDAFGGFRCLDDIAQG